jgi:hypothetical protein
VLLFDRATRDLGLRAARPDEEKQAFKAVRKKSEKHYRVIMAAAFLKPAGLVPKETIVFEDCSIDRGVLVLELGGKR